ncbi:MAG: hypothetical protein AD742_00020 [Methylibium sp. NZG]|nr:MAG: hypothetical protein AD742_00020 [Methylibium sp. NZG]
MHRLERRFIIVSGLPASGKSAVARALAQALRVELLDKDEFLESRFEQCGIGDAAHRRQLSVEADAAFRRRAERSPAAVLASWWKHPLSLADSGTPSTWLAALPGTKVEVHCECSADLAAARFMARARHPGHLDTRWTHAGLVAAFAPLASFGPMGFGAVIRLATDVAWDAGTLAAQVASALATGASANPASNNERA